MKPGKRGVSRAIVKVGTDAVSAAQKVFPFIAAPGLATGFVLAVALGQLGPQVWELYRDWRVRRALKLVIESDNWNNYYQEQVRVGGAERLGRELVDMLRDLEAAVADSAVDPLIRLFQHRAQGTVSWPVIRAISRTLRQLNDDEIASLRAMLEHAESGNKQSDIIFSSAASIENGGPALIVGSTYGDQTEVQGLDNVQDVLRVLVSNGAAGNYTPSQAQASGDNLGPSESIIVGRELADLLLKLLRG